MMERQRVLLVIAVSLLGVRYALLPLLEWQRDARDALVVTSRRLDRAEDLLLNRVQVKASLDQMEKAVASLRAQFPVKSDSDTARLDFQREINEVLGSKGLTVRVFDWVVETPVEGTALNSLRARVSVSGGMRSLANAGAVLETRLSHAEIRELRLNFATPANLEADPVGDGYFVIDLTYLREAAK